MIYHPPRKESTRHMMAVDAITKYLGLGSYKDWDEATKINWLQQEIAGKRPLFRTRDIDMLGFDPLVIDTLKTIEVASKLGPGALGAYVISQVKSIFITYYHHLDQNAIMFLYISHLIMWHLST